MLLEIINFIIISNLGLICAHLTDITYSIKISKI